MSGPSGAASSRSPDPSAPITRRQPEDTYATSEPAGSGRGSATGVTAGSCHAPVPGAPSPGVPLPSPGVPLPGAPSPGAVAGPRLAAQSRPESGNTARPAARSVA